MRSKRFEREKWLKSAKIKRIANRRNRRDLFRNPANRWRKIPMISLVFSFRFLANFCPFPETMNRTAITLAFAGIRAIRPGLVQGKMRNVGIINSWAFF
jgi:hypothetical protein